jgi:membrane protein
VYSLIGTYRSTGGADYSKAGKGRRIQAPGYSWHNADMDQILTLLRPLWHRIRYLVGRFGADHCSETAAALTYMSLFALVPLLTVLYTMASAIPAFQGMENNIQDLLFEHLMPETSSDIETYLSDFSRQAKNLTGVGIGFLVATAVLMLRNIEKAFNKIWRTRENRGAVSSFLLYWAVLSLAPLTIGLALAISTYLASYAVMFQDYDVIGAGSILLMVAAIAFNVARSAFTGLVVGSNYTFIYGAFAAVPLFLLWIYLSWNIVLIGGILVHSLSAYQTLEEASRPTVFKALDVLYLFWQRQKSGTGVREIELLDNRHEALKGLDSETWRELRDIFLQKQLITQNDRGRYLLCRDLHEISFWQIKEWINEELPLLKDDIDAHLSWQDDAYRLLKDQRGHSPAVRRLRHSA